MYEKNNITKFKRIARILRIITLTEMWSVAVLAGITAIADVVFMFLPQHAFELGSETIKHLSFSADSIMSYKFITAPGTITNIKPLLNSISVMVIISAVLLIPISYQLSLILKSVENASPFTDDNASRLNIIGRILCLGAFLYPLAEYIAAKMVMEIIKNPQITAHYSAINFSMLLSGILVLILGGIFKYGNYLQEEYDATL